MLSAVRDQKGKKGKGRFPIRLFISSGWNYCYVTSVDVLYPKGRTRIIFLFVLRFVARQSDR